MAAISTESGQFLFLLAQKNGKAQFHNEHKDTKMTAKKTGATIGRPRKEPPADAADKVRALAADGHSLVGIAERLGVALDTFKRWCDEDLALQEALSQGREKERYRLHNLLSQAADGGNITAMIFLLKAKHGYVEGAASRSGQQGKHHVSVARCAETRTIYYDGEYQ